MVETRQHLPQEPERDELDAHEDEENREKEDGAVGERNTEEDPLDAEVEGHERTHCGREDARDPEDVDRPREEARQELHGHEIEEHPGRAPQSVFRLSAQSRPVAHGHLDDGRA